MAIDEARRPRRIIESPRSPDAGTPLLRLAERFQRALLPRAERPARSRSRPDDDQPEPVAAPAGTGSAGALDAAAGPPASSPFAGSQQTRALHRHAPLLPVDEETGTAQQWTADIDESPEDGWQAELARLIARLCNCADAQIEGWTVTLPMRPAVLPATTLQLELSSHWLALRFRTESPRSLFLLSRHRSELEALLRQSLQRDQQVDIEIS